MTVLAETRQLSLHPLAIHTFIKAQAGSLGKALSEAVMNSIDAFAKNINITITTTGFVIEDDGQGFREKAEIAAWFETLGFPHDDGNHRTYGKFGMGRAQMWAFASTVWQSNQFVMRVDVQKRGLNYDLEEIGERFNGTRIEAKFYTALSFQEVQSTQMELASLVRYAPGLITLNGTAISRNPALEEWDLETPQAWMHFDTKRNAELVVYNGGVLVAKYANYRFGCGGVVVTKPEYTLSLNLARNDILVSDCKVWPLITKHFPKKDETKKAPPPAKPTRRELEAKGREVTAGVRPLRDALKSMPSLLVSVTGRSMQWYDLVNAYYTNTVLFMPKGDKLGRRLSKLRRATVVAREVLDYFGVQTPDELKALVRKDLAGSDDYYRDKYLKQLDESVWSVDAVATFPDILTGKEIYANSELDSAEMGARQSWTRAWNAFMNAAGVVFEDTYERNRFRRINSILLGDSPLWQSWISDDTDYVLRKAEFMKAMNRPMPELTAYVNARILALFQEFAGDKDRGTALFVKLATETPALGNFLLSVIQGYIRECTSRDLPVPRTALADLDNLGAE